jgi:probable F420-dependent oxidoreductase, MSMEG_2256 family
MRIDANLLPDTLAAAEAQAREAEAAGYQGIWCGEAAHDAFLTVSAVARGTTRVTVGTAIVVAFARSPMTVAYQANDLQLYAQGRFVLGLGTQVRPHIERRFSMPWSAPARRMREYVAALRAIWRSWQTGERLDFRGDLYSHTLMTPFFSPGPNPYGPPPVVLAAVGERMVRVAGEVADGLIVHPFTSADYLRDRIRPALTGPLSERGRTLADFTVILSGMVATGEDEVALARAVEAVRGRIAFYASTPAYRPVLAQHGWEAVGEELTRLSRLDSPDRWDRMRRLVDDRMLHTFAIVAPPEQVPAAVLDRFGGLVDRFSLNVPYDLDPLLINRIAAELARQAEARTRKEAGA